MGDELKVTQADRDAAKDAWEKAALADEGILAEAFARHRIAAETQSQATIDELVGALKECRDRFRRCIIHNGTDPEYADAAVAEYDTLIAKAGGQS